MTVTVQHWRQTSHLHYMHEGRCEVKGRVTNEFKENLETCSSHVMNVRGGFLLTHALSRYQYLINQLWCKLQCITYHQVKSCLVRNAVLGRICAGRGVLTKKNKTKTRICTTCTTHMLSFLRRCSVVMEQYRFRLLREVPYKKNMLYMANSL